MKNFILYFLCISVILSLVACGQGENKTGYTVDEEEISAIELKIAASHDEEALELIRGFIDQKLDKDAYSGLYMAHEPSTHFVVLIQELHSLAEAAVALEEYSDQVSNSSSDVYPVKLKSAKYSYQTLDMIMNQLQVARDELIITDRKVISFGTNEIENRVDLYVSAISDLNIELIDEITAGYEGIINIQSGVMDSVDDNGLPTTDPYITGSIMEINEGDRLVLLIEDQIYVSIDKATLIQDKEGNKISENQLKLGDTVTIWTDGGILQSLPAQGYAVAILLH